MSARVSLRKALIIGILGAAGMTCAIQPIASRVIAANLPKPTIGEDARSAIARMGTTLQTKEFSFQARTIRVYADQNGELLHIVHNFKITVRRPDRLLVDGSGDDGPTKLIYDGATAMLALDDGKKFASVPVPATIDGMMQVVIGHFDVDFPLADFLTEAPDKSFLMGVTAGRQVNIVTIDGVPCRHLVFSQPPGIELELWLENNDQSVPRRLIVTYHSLPGQPNFVAEMSDWNFNVHPSDAEFKFEPPQGADQIPLGAAIRQSTGAQ